MEALPFGLQSVEQVMAHVEARAANRETIEVSSPFDIGLHYREADKSNPQGGFFAKVPVTMKNGDTKMCDLPLNKSALKGAIKLISGSPAYFAQFDDHNALPESFNHVMSSPRRQGQGSFLVRHNKLEIVSVLPYNYNIKDAADLLGGFVPALQENVGKIVGISALEGGDGEGDTNSYRVVMGNNIMPSLSSDEGQFMMFNINTSESGLHDTRTSLGLYRTMCDNSAIRVQTLSRYDHKEAFSPFYDRVARSIREAGYLQESYGKIFEELLREKLAYPALDLIDAFKRENLISKAHAKNAEVYAETEPNETSWDLFNILTRSAQDLPVIRERETGETAAMNIFTTPGGVLETLRRAEARKSRSGKIGPILEN